MKRENNKKFKKRKRNQNRSLTCRVLSMMFAIVLFCSTVLINERANPPAMLGRIV